MYNLLRHPAVLHHVQREVDTVFGPDDNYVPTYDDIGKLTYLRQVIDETLRLSPPASSFDRMAIADTVIGGKYPVKQGEAVTVLIGALHRQPQWGDNVELFDPDRFAPERTAGRPASVFKPFGTGARSCIGRQFALHEAALTLGRLVHRYRLLDVGHYTLGLESKLRRRPVGFLLELGARTSAERSHPVNGVPAAAATAPISGQPGSVVPGTTLAVLHGSNLGTCRALAKHFADEATNSGCTTTVSPLDSAKGGLPDADVVLIVASSYNGQPTDDAGDFLAWLNAADTELANAPLYAVLGVGDHNWSDTYQAVPRLIDQRLLQLGGQQVVPRAEADTSGDLNGVVEDFSVALAAALSQRFGDPSAAPQDESTAEPLYSVHRLEGPLTAAIDTRFEVVPMTVLENNELVSADNPLGQAKRHVRIALPEGVSYQTGDHLTVLADNPPELVARVLEKFEIDPDLRLSINPRRTSGRLIALDREVTARELLTHFVELRKPATRSQLRQLAEANPCPPERRRLEDLAAGSESVVLSPLECLLDFPGCQLSAEEVLELLDPMTPRHYSIASSSRLSPGTAALVVSVLDTEARSGHGLYQGVASNHLASAKPGQQIRARVDRARKAFRAGADPKKNVILVSAGTGVAPFCGFLGDRFAAKEAGEPFSPALCFFGIRHPDVDYVFRDQFEAAAEEGIVLMRPAFSRAPREGVRYVQDRIAANADEVWSLIGDSAKDTHIYVCGDGAKMAPAVRSAFIDIFRARTGASESQARDWLIDQVKSDHYVEDVWAE
ncbi:cytochrome P450 [Mycolicibacterium sp. CBMA 334]|nr:cytochrome P450 [Mycolicibacterium sp. CBMA 334]